MNSSPSYACLNKAWRQYKAELRGFLAHRMPVAGDADDLLQEVFLKALLHGHDFCRLDNPRAWLFHVARNLLVDRLRVHREQVPLPDDLRDDEANGNGPVDPVDLLSHCLPRVLSELSAEDRDAITRCDIESTTQRDYAYQSGLSLPAAKSRVQRARLRLQAQLVTACQVKFDEQGKVCCFVPRPPLNDPKA